MSERDTAELAEALRASQLFYGTPVEEEEVARFILHSDWLAHRVVSWVRASREAAAKALREAAAAWSSPISCATCMYVDSWLRARADEVDATEPREPSERDVFEALADRWEREADVICPPREYDEADKAWRVAHVRRRCAADLRAALRGDA